MARTNIDIDEAACRAVMQQHGFTTKREAVNFALRQVGNVASLEEVLAMRGTGWDGDEDASLTPPVLREWLERPVE